MRGRFILAAFLSLFSPYIFCQTKISLGIKINPTMTLAYKSRSSSYNENNFKLLNYYIKPQFGLIASATLKKFLFDYTFLIGSKKVGFMFYNFSEPYNTNYEKLRYSSTTLSNKMFFGYLFSRRQKPFYRAYVVVNFGVDFNAITGESGSANFDTSSIDSLTEELPKFPTKYNSLSSGIGLKIRSKNKLLGLFDFGVTYDHSFTHHPPISYTASVASKPYYGILRPILDYISIDFIVYFRTREHKQKWEKISYKEYN